MFTTQCSSCNAIVVVADPEFDEKQEGLYEVVCACENRIQVVIRKAVIATGVITAQSRG